MAGFAGGRPLLCALAAVLLVLLIWAFAGSAASRRYQNYLGGVWVGDPSFLRTADASDFMLFVGPEEGSGRPGYIRIVDSSGEVVASQALTLRVSQGPGRWGPALRSALAGSRDALTFTASLEFDEVVPEAPIPGAVSLSVSLLEGTLAIFDGQKVYAFLEKDLAASASALAEYSAE